MNVFDPLQAYASGQPAAEAFIQGQRMALQRRQEARDDEKMKWLRQEHDRQSRANLLREQGMSELQSLIDNGTPFQDAFFKVGPKLYADDPAKLGTLLEARYNHEMQRAHLKAMDDTRKEANDIRLKMLPEEQAKAMAEHEQNVIDLQKAIKNVPKEAPMDQPEMGEQDYQKLDALNRRLTAEKSIASALRARIEKPYVQEKERNEKVDLELEKAQLEQALEANPNNAAARNRLNEVMVRIATWDQQHPGGQSTEVTSDAQGNLKLTMQPGKIQPGAASEIQRELANDHTAITQIRRARETLTDKDVGVSGVVYDDLLNRWVRQAVPGAGDPNVSANRVLLQKAVDSYIQTQSRLGRLSASEREEMRSALVTRKAGEEIGRVRSVLDTMARVQQFDAIAKAKQARQALEPWMFEGLSQQEISQLKKEGTLTEQEAIAWMLKAPYKERPRATP